MITVHHLNNSRSQRILWLLEELGLEYKIEKYQRDPVTMLAPPSLKKVHPLGKSPVITDDDKLVAESGTIIDYLVTNYSNGEMVPAHNSDEYWQYSYWLNFAEGSLAPPLLLNLVMQKIKQNAKPFFVKFIANQIVAKVMASFVSPNIHRNYAFVNEHLKNNLWFTGDKFTGADIQMSFPLETGAARGLANNYQYILDYVQRIHARPAYQQALEKGGKYDYS